MDDNQLVKNRANILVLGIGNILLTDEGVGVHAIHKLEEHDFGPDVELVDGEIGRAHV